MMDDSFRLQMLFFILFACSGAATPSLADSSSLLSGFVSSFRSAQRTLTPRKLKAKNLESNASNFHSLSHY
jgi:hypothetical protein